MAEQYIVLRRRFNGFIEDVTRNVAEGYPAIQKREVAVLLTWESFMGSDITLAPSYSNSVRERVKLAKALIALTLKGHAKYEDEECWIVKKEAPPGRELDMLID